ncbi:hypothetical protein SPONN_2237 [uncultured Candidatus Thioglobus sp.]|nr:hypothetical protein SPONN_2237 [uncultured Candidatus Thioglobus sp.]
MKTPEKSTAFVAGSYRRHFRNTQFAYQSFLPTKVNQPYRWADQRISMMLERAMGLVGELNAYSRLIPNVDFFIKMHSLREAVESSRIEGTETGMDEAVLSAAEIAPEKRNDWKEVQNYVLAMNHAIDKLGELPICMRLLRQAHKILMTGVRGESRQPGKVRAMQNWIGGTNIQTASFIPPHPDDLPNLLQDLEVFWNNQNLYLPHLIKIAISHYQFETLHPFNDGNGRIGRMLIVLHLIEFGVLQKPTLHLSDFIERNKSAYYDSLTFVRERNDMEQWILFFLSAVTETAQKGKDTFEQIVALRANYEQRIRALGRRAESAYKLLERLFSAPAISVADVSRQLDCSVSTANTLCGQMQQADLLREVTGHSRNRVFVLHQYVRLFGHE